MVSFPGLALFHMEGDRITRGAEADALVWLSEEPAVWEEPDYCGYTLRQARYLHCTLKKVPSSNLHDFQASIFACYRSWWFWTPTSIHK